MSDIEKTSSAEGAVASVGGSGNGDYDDDHEVFKATGNGQQFRSVSW